MSTAKTAAKTAEQASPAQEVKSMFVLDTTAGPDTQDSQGRPVTGSRTHEQIIDGAIRPFTFYHGKALELPYAIAAKFLKIESFKHVDKDGNILAYARPPRQPDQLEAGEKLVLAQNETVARYDELSTTALQQRALEMPGGEKFAESPKREAMIEFIVAAKIKAAKANMGAPDTKSDEFTPPAEFEDAA